MALLESWRSRLWRVGHALGQKNKQQHFCTTARYPIQVKVRSVPLRKVFLAIVKIPRKVLGGHKTFNNLQKNNFQNFLETCFKEALALVAKHVFKF